MVNTLKEYLDSKKCFKLICALGNKNLEEIKRLCALYATAGCRFFDINASVEAIKSAKEGFKIAKREHECFICVSVGTKNDPHLSKCKINKDKCSHCKKCQNVCPQRAIEDVIIEDKCIGCKRCAQVCPNGAIETYSKEISLAEILPPLIKEGIDCIEYHVITDSEEDVISGWKIITGLFKGALSVSLDRSKTGNEKLISRLKTLKNSCNNLFMVQADGAPMTGARDDFRTTLQAVAMADIVDKAQITPYIIISGGTNSKTMELARQCEVDVCGFAGGSWARKIVREYIEKDDFLSNKAVFNEALKIAKELVEKL